MNIIKVHEAENLKNPHGINVKKIYDTEHAQTMHLTLAPGEALRKHLTPVDVFFYVLEGTGIVEIGGEEQEVGADTLIDSPANIPHCWYNRSAAPVRILVVKVPRPTTAPKFVD